MAQKLIDVTKGFAFIFYNLVNLASTNQKQQGPKWIQKNFFESLLTLNLNPNRTTHSPFFFAPLHLAYIIGPFQKDIPLFSSILSI